MSWERKARDYLENVFNWLSIYSVTYTTETIAQIPVIQLMQDCSFLWEAKDTPIQPLSLLYPRVFSQNVQLEQKPPAVYIQFQPLYYIIVFLYINSFASHNNSVRLSTPTATLQMTKLKFRDNWSKVIKTSNYIPDRNIRKWCLLYLNKSRNRFSSFTEDTHSVQRLDFSSPTLS